MHRPLLRRISSAGRLVLAIASIVPTVARAQSPPALETVPGQFFKVVEPITSDTLAQLKTSTRQLVDRVARGGVKPVLVFEIRPGETAPGASDFGVSYSLATFISTKLGDAWTVAFVPQPLNGYALLPALACDEIVVGTGASLGPITPEGEDVERAHRDPVRVLAQRKGRDPGLFVGMLDRDANLRALKTADGQLHYVMPDSLPEFKTSHQVVADDPAWEGGLRGVLSATRAREQGFAKLVADSAAEVAASYRLAGRSVSQDPTLGQDLRPVWIQIIGPVDSVMKSYLSRRIEQARQEKVNLIFFQINSQGGVDTAADAVADLISNVGDMKTVAFVDDNALGVSALVALSCHDIVLRKGASLGDVHQIVTGRNGQVQDLDDAQIQSIGRRAANLAELRGHSPAVARAMVDPTAVLVEAKDARTGGPSFVLQTQINEDPTRYLSPEVRKPAGKVLTVSGDAAATYGMGAVVGDVEELKGLYGLKGKPIRVDGPTWVDGLVTVLTEPFVSWLLLFVGLFMLVLELKLPGIGLPAVMSALAFLLFFWSHYLSGTADQLEIILFLVGMVCLALELFVFPGFGVFGMSGVLLILTSIVMASHSFVWPTKDYEYREMGFTLIQVIGVMIAVGGAAAVLAQYMPSIPLFNRLILKAEPWTGVDESASIRAGEEFSEPLAFLIGETGRTTTVLRPTGKARFGERLLDVTAAGSFIEPDSLIEVIDVQGRRVIVKLADV